MTSLVGKMRQLSEITQSFGKESEMNWEDVSRKGNPMGEIKRLKDFWF